MNNSDEIAIKANPEFTQNVPHKIRKVWFKALMACPYDQALGVMQIENDGRITGQCCLMVGHEAFGGTRGTRGDTLPYHNSMFTQHMFDNDPMIGVRCTNLPELGEKVLSPVSASACNDTHKFTFKQIAKLLVPEDYPDFKIEID